MDLDKSHLSQNNWYIIEYVLIFGHHFSPFQGSPIRLHKLCQHL